MKFCRKGDFTMEDTPRDKSGETDCTITVYDGAWLTCDMIEEDADD
jgi:hypothetical protein